MCVLCLLSVIDEFELVSCDSITLSIAVDTFVVGSATDECKTDAKGAELRCL